MVDFRGKVLKVGHEKMIDEISIYLTKDMIMAEEEISCRKINLH